MEKNQKVTLGYGTLIIIALIVLIFSNESTGPRKQEMEAVRQELHALQAVVSSQTQEIQDLKEMLEKLLPSSMEADTNE